MKIRTGIELIAAERERQIKVEGWTPEHDDTHTGGEMANAASAYAHQAADRGWLIYDPGMIGIPPDQGPERYQSDGPPDCRPYEWDEQLWWKPKTPILDLIRAGALIAAEIDRLLRKEEAAK